MSVLIKGMDMPKDCEHCGLSWLYEEGWYCEIKDEPLDGYEACKGRLGDCPLVEVPTPHGRLIDAEALFTREPFKYMGNCEEQKCSTCDYYETDGACKMIDAIKNEISVIESED